MNKIFNKKRGFVSVLAMIMLVAVTLSGCGRSKNAEKSYDYAVTEAACAPTAAYEADFKGDYFDEITYTKEDYGWAEAPEMESMYENGSTYDTSIGTASQNGAADALEEAALADRKLIKNVSLSMQTLEFDNCIAGLERAIGVCGGYVQFSSVSNNPYTYTNSNYRYMRYANYTIRIPRERLDEFVKTVGNIGNITSQNLNTEDVTLNYLDTESRAEALKIQQERLLALLEKADDIDAIISLEARLSDVTYELEAKERVLKNYDNLVEFSTVRLDISEVERITYVEPEPLTFGQRIREGLSDTFYDIKEGFKDFVYWVVVEFPYIIFWLAVIAVVVILIVRKIKKIRKNRINKRLAQQFAVKPVNNTAGTASDNSEQAENK